jgi:hypothetical protein
MILKVCAFEIMHSSRSWLEIPEISVAFKSIGWQILPVSVVSAILCVFHILRNFFAAESGKVLVCDLWVKCILL